ncbi:putative MFS family arabinose efflux permease [Microbacterium natoriense]|uniref:MFS family arabinose efflux permease n=1 Tax=Microbacterium natoriense TaxID=284570 RepID=A0AAW8EX16_9MICO|nr:MFS transporter [Microbacterium natoriense]MDQ0648030.1 putative MFS family arabinose efflux permease [Microbacterium natoriense]
MIRATRDRQGLTASSLLALATGMTLGNVGGNLMPLLLDGFMKRFDLSATTAGMIAAVQLLMTAAVALTFSARAAGLGRVRLSQIGLAVAAIGFTCAWIAPSTEILFGANAVIGAGLGATFAAASAALSSTPNSDRATTLTLLSSTIAIAALILAIPLANRLLGDAGGFALLAGCCALGLVLVRGLPRTTMAHRAGDGPPLSWVFVAAVALFGMSEQGIWSYADVLGRTGAGLDASSAAAVLGVAAIAALAGVPLGVLLRRVVGTRAALACVLALGVAAKVAVVTTGSPGVFAVACVVWQVGYLATLVLVLAAAAQFDRSGRWVAASAGALALGTGIGPAAVGLTLDHLGPTGLATGVVIAISLAAIRLLQLPLSPNGAVTESLDSDAPSA